MKYLYFILVTLTILSCRNEMRGSGNIIKEPRQLSAFNSIDVSGLIKVDVKTGNTASLTVEADDNIVPHVVTTVSDNNLSVKLKGINNLKNASIHIYIVVPTLTKISSSSSAEVRSTDIITNSEKISFKASSGSLINFKVDAPSITAGGSSGADIILTGRTKNLLAESSSGSSVNLFGLLAEKASANASSGAKTAVFGSVEIKANASSGGNVSYKGGAPSVEKNVSSGGAVNAE